MTEKKKGISLDHIYKFVGIVGTLLTMAFAFGVFKMDKVEETSESTQRKVDTITKILREEVVKHEVPVKVEEEPERVDRVVKEVNSKTVIIDTVVNVREVVKDPFGTVRNDRYKEKSNSNEVKISESEFINVAVSGDFKVRNNSTIYFSIVDACVLSTKQIQRNTLIQGTCKLENDRIKVKIGQIKDFFVNLELIDSDGESGLPKTDILKDGVKVKFLNKNF
jgi:hypothetical protein